MNHSQNSELSEPIDDGADVESDSSSSSSSGSSDSSFSTDSSLKAADELQLLDMLELAEIKKEMFSLPRGLCENAVIFREFFSPETWQLLPEQVQLHLQQYLPNFSMVLGPHEAAVEQQRTLSMLFKGQLRRFNHTPLGDLQRNLEAGNYRPDVLQLRQSIAKSRQREHRFRTCERLSQLAKEMFLSREQLLRKAYKSAPDTVLRSERSLRRQKSTLLYTDTKLYAVRARKRFYTEIRDISQQLDMQQAELSADEEDNTDAPTAEELRYDALQVDGAENNMNAKGTIFCVTSSSTDKCIYSTLFKRRHDREDDEVVIRATQHSKEPRLCNRNFRQYLLEHKRRKLTEPTLPDFETSDIRLRDVCARAQLGGNFKRFFAVGKTPGRKSKSKINSANGPPALVPIQPPHIRKVSELTQSHTNENFFNITLKKIATGDFAHAQKPLTLSSQMQLPLSTIDSKEAFHIMDSEEVDLQQEEVETFGSTICEETIPAFVISNEIVLPPVVAQNVEISQHASTVSQQNMDMQLLDEETDLSALHESTHNLELSINSIPKLEPIMAANKNIDRSLIAGKLGSPAKTQSKPTSVLSTLAPTSKQQAISVNAKGGVSSFITNTELIQETHACFFSLIRDFFCSTTNHRMKFDDLKDKIDVWLYNPITALNDWYSQAENWSALLNSAINFLAGNFTEQPEEYVPYIEYKTQLNIYQWIGAGRDSDARLTALCKYWLQRRIELADKSIVVEQHFDDASMLLRRRSNDIEDAGSAYDSGSGGASPPPPPRCPTTWTVRAATTSEVAEFQRQERERFDNPHRAYTYRMHGYESVVGPVKGIYSQILALTKARGHSMMIGDRPNFVTILTLVRDATARLPNGEGTRADISELLKCSQYINRDAAENVLQTIVSGALDRMHTEHDPCVRYDPKRKIWIYLHRNRTENEFERMHQQNQALNKQQKKPPQRKQKTKTLLKDGTTVDLDVLSANNVAAAPTTTLHTSTLSLPALVPANPIIVHSKALLGQQQQQQQQPQLAKCPPVPPLKYNIPTQANSQQQQQKSLLKSTLHMQRQTETAVKIALSPVPADTSGRTSESSQLLLTGQRNLVRHAANAASTATVANTVKQFSFSLPQMKAGVTNSTPIIVATSSGLQTVHVSHANTVPTNALPATTIQQQLQAQTPALSATVGGKKVALNKPIVINQISSGQQQQQGLTKLTKSPQGTKHHQQQQQQNLFLPINVSTGNRSISTVTEGSGVPTVKEAPMRNISTILMGNSAQLVDASAQQTSSIAAATKQRTTTKNIIRLVPATVGANSGQVKSLISPSNAVNTVPANSGKPAVQIIGQRVISNATARTQVQQQQLQQPKNVTIAGGIVISSNVNSSAASAQPSSETGGTTAPGSSTIFKMTPQAFASLQQKQAGGQQILVRQAGAATTQQQQRVVVGNTAIIAQSVQSGGKNIVLQQKPLNTHIVAANHKATTTTAVKASPGVVTTAGTVHKVQNINATNLTPQQQRVLLQNLRQQQQQHQQQIQYKTVQVVANSPQQKQQAEQLQPTQGRGQIVNVVPQQRASGVLQTAKQSGKTVAVVVSQPQGLSRILKTTPSMPLQQQQQQQQQHQHQHQITVAANDASSGTRVVSSSTGQIISLETLLQKQGGALRIASGNDTKAMSQTNPTNLIQLASSGVQTAGASSTQYAVVSQPRNIISIGTPHRLITAQALSTPVTVAVSTAGAATGAKLASTSRIIMPEVSSVNAAKIMGKTNVIAAGGRNDPSAVSSSGNIRVINAAGAATSLNIANIQGKQVVFATKPNNAGTNVKNVVTSLPTSSQAQHLQNTGLIIGTPTVKIHQAKGQQLNKVGGVISVQQPMAPQMQTVIVGNQILRVQQLASQVPKALQHRVTVSGTNMALANAANTTNTSSIVGNSKEVPKTIVLGTAGQTLRLQSTSAQAGIGRNVITSPQSSSAGGKASPASRVVLAVQGGSQIFLSPNFQGGSLNLKSLQNMRVVPLTQSQPANKDVNAHQQDKLLNNATQKMTPQQSMLKGSSSNAAD